METVRIDNNTGMRIGVAVSDEMRGHDDVYDPWLRIPMDEVNRRAKRLMGRYPNDLDGMVAEMNAGGTNHINRVLFNKIWSSLDNREKFAHRVMKLCTPKVNVLFKQFYAHRLYEKKQYDECHEQLQQSVDMAKLFPDPSWDKWVVSGHFFRARYYFKKDEKTEYCIKALLEPRTLNYSPHLKYWKVFRAAAWLIGNGVDTPEALSAIKRYKKLGFDGYIEVRGGGKDEYRTIGVLDNPKKCVGLMSDDLQHHIGNP